MKNRLIVITILFIVIYGIAGAGTPKEEWDAEMSKCAKQLSEAKTDAEKIVILEYQAKIGAAFISKGLPLSAYQRKLVSGPSGVDINADDVGTIELILK